jgi:hypothetical protein
MRSLEFKIDLILSAQGSTQPLIEMSIMNLPGVKGGRHIKLTIVCRKTLHGETCICPLRGGL